MVGVSEVVPGRITESGSLMVKQLAHDKLIAGSSPVRSNLITKISYNFGRWQSG